VAWRTLILPKPEFTVATSAAMGLVKRVNLPDGSTVRLNSGAAVQVEYTHALRRIRLDQGEASFDVAKDPARPFIVTTSGVDVSAVGTVFTVSSRSRAVEVLVSEGKVRVNDAARGESLIVPTGTQARETNQPVLAAGEKVIIVVDAKSSPAPVVPTVIPAAEIVAALAWQERRLDFFESTPLSQIAAQFNRFNHHQVVIADATLGSQRFAGSFRADDPETFIQLIKTRPGVNVERKVGETVIRKAE
jgi:transmembrane sensor